MEPSTKIGIVTATIILLAFGIWYISLNEKAARFASPAQPSIQPAVRFPAKEWSAKQAIPQERILVQFLGEPVKLDATKEALASRLFLKVTQEDPQRWGSINIEIADDVIKQRMQTTAIMLANMSNIDLVCESYVNEDAACKDIDKQYQKIHSGMPSHFTLYPIGETNCEKVRGIASGDLCGQGSKIPKKGQISFLCQGISKKDCRAAYRDAIQDYTYALMTLETGNPEFCQLIGEETLKSWCESKDWTSMQEDIASGFILAGNKEIVRR